MVLSSYTEELAAELAVKVILSETVHKQTSYQQLTILSSVPAKKPFKIACCRVYLTPYSSVIISVSK